MSTTALKLKPLEAKVESIGGKRWYSFETESGPKTFPSVTTVLDETKDKRGLEAWKKRVGAEEAERLREAGLERGTRFHEWVESYLRDGTEPSTETQSIWTTWWSAQKAEPLLTEAPLYSDIGYAGTADLVANTPLGICIYDWKTASKIPKREAYIYDYKLQVSSYAKAVEERYNVEVKRACLAFAVEGEPEVHQVDVNPELYFLSFRDRLSDYYWG